MKKRLVVFLLMICLLLSYLPLSISASTADVEEVSAENCHTMTEQWFGSEPAKRTIRSSENADELQGALSAYFEAREEEFSGISATKRVATNQSATVQANMRTRADRIEAFQERIQIDITDAEITTFCDNNHILYNEDGTVTLFVYEWTFFDYDDLRDIVVATDVSGYGVYHKITLEEAAEGTYRILTDEYDESDLLGLCTMNSSTEEELLAMNYEPIDIDTPIIEVLQSEIETVSVETAKRGTYYSAYNPDAAANYADKYVYHGAQGGAVYEGYYNSAYYNFNAVGGDCANYTSQCINAGGMPQVVCAAYGTDGWYYKSSSDRSATWASTTNLRNWMANNRGTKVTASNTTVYKGSPVFYNDAHTTICVGTNSAGTPIINSHNKDYYHTVWNYWGSGTTYATVQLTGSNSTDDQPASNPCFSGINWPTAIKEGSAYSFFGSVSSTELIHYVGVYVSDINGNDILSKSVSPYTYSYNIHELDDYIAFGKLSPGTYTFRVEATDDAGRFTWDNREFVVYSDIGSDLYGLIINLASWKLIAPDDSGNVIIQKETGSQKQYWRLTHNDDGTYTIKSEKNGCVLDDAEHGNEIGANVQVYESHGGANQRWWIMRYGDGYLLRPACANLVLDMTCNDPTDGTNIQLWTQHGEASQVWAIYTDLASYTVSYNANGGTGAPTAQTKKQGTDLTLSTIKPSRSGYTFTGWNTKSDGTGTSYAAGGTYISNANATLYAQWKKGCADAHSYTYKVTKTPTTSSTGILLGTCSKCGATSSVTLPKLNTSDYNYSIVKAATCTTTGTGRYTWKTTTYGSYYFDVTLAKTAHNYTAAVTAPTCTAQGYTTHTCSACGDSYKDTYTAALGHNYSYKVTSTPTASATGALTGTCSRCSGTTTVTLPKLNTTDYSYSVVKAATCTATGTGRYTWKTTTYGSYYFDVTIAKTAHNYTATVTAPTCTAQGYTTHTCTGCGDSYKDTYTAALGHNYSYKVTTAPATAATGALTGTCSRCSGTMTVTLPKLNTTDYSYSVVKAATCTATGTGRYTWKTTTYGSYYFDVTIAKTAHTYTATVTAPTCTAQGYTTHTCSDCGDSYKDTYTAALGHSESAWIVDRNATCTASGSKHTECTRCGVVMQTATIAANGHTVGAWIIDKNATCTASGTKHTECTVCGATLETATIPAAGHSYTASVTAPTCTEKGFTTHTCTACGDSYKDTYTAELGHTWDGGKVTTQPTETTEGVKTFTCTRCGATKTESIPVLGHTHQYTEQVTEPTCTEKGYTTHTCACGDSYVDRYVDALGHAWDGGRVTTQPTVTESGVKTFTCTRCNATRTESIPATGEQNEKPCDGGADCPSGKFVDVNPKEWYHPYVDYAVAHGLFGGTSENTFEPEAAMTRAMLVTVLWRYEGKPMGYQNTFSDVNAKDGSWYMDAVAWAAANGVVNGVGNGRFDPEGKITREQMAAILFRYAQQKGYDTSKRAELSKFPDNGKVSDYAREALAWANAEGLINGDEQSSGTVLLDPAGNATRAQVSAILMRYVQNAVK